MRARHPRNRDWPIRWLMTDERMGEQLLPAIRKLPAGSGVVFRHYRLSPEARLRLGLQVRAEARRRHHVLAIAGDTNLARILNADLVHQPSGSAGLQPFSCSVHNKQEADRARARGAALVFVSPLFATRSHPGGAALGLERAADLAARAGRPAIALGGVDETHLVDLRKAGFHGYAGIDCWLRT